MKKKLAILAYFVFLVVLPIVDVISDIFAGISLIR
jgi:hypothetical protein